MGEPQLPDLNKKDELDRVLAARPALKAPSHMSSRVMARIAALPPQASVAGPISNPATWMVATPAPVIKYVPPEVKPLPQPVDAAADRVDDILDNQQRRYSMGLVFTGVWLGLCILVLWTLWPAISNLVFGPSGDLDMQARLATLQKVWSNVSDFVREFASAIAPQLPTLVSAAVGLALMTALIFSSNITRRFRTQ